MSPESLEPTIASLMAGADAGDRAAADDLFSALYAELHRMARRELAKHGPAVTLGATTLLHEAYLEMAGRSGPDFPDRARFMAYSARVMRGLVIDHARSHQAHKRGGQFEFTSIAAELADNAADDKELVRLSESLEELANVDAPLAELVDLKFFCGFSFAEIAAMRGLSERTVQRHWDRARLYLHRSLRVDSLT